MQITEPRLEEFIGLYRAKYGVDLARDEALVKAQQMLGFVRLSLSRFNEKNEYEKRMDQTL